MQAFWGLFKKDMSLVRFWSIAWLICAGAGLLAGLVAAYKMGDISLFVPMYVFAMTAQLLFTPIMLIYLLNLEGKTQMWLYNPQSSWKLLLSKVAAVTSFEVITQLLFIAYGFIFLKVGMATNAFDATQDWFPMNLIMYFHLLLFLMSIYFGVLVTFYWTIYHALGRFPQLQRFRWLVLVGIYIGWNTIETFIVHVLGKTPLFSFDIQVDTVPNMHYDQVGKNWSVVSSQGNVDTPLILIFLYAIVAIIVFLISSRLLDRKVEV